MTTTDTLTPIIPTPAWKRDIRDAFWGEPQLRPDLISLNEVADRIGIQRDSMSCNATERPMWFPFDVVTTGRSPNGGARTRYYRRSEVERWISQYCKRQSQAEHAAKRAQMAQEARKPEKTHPPTPDGGSARTGRAEREEA